MFVYAGIDEAGYGPLIGPLVVARSVFALERQVPFLEPPSLWGLLSSAVCKRASDRKGRLAINDSKALYSPAWSLRSLERGVLSFLSTSGIGPRNLDDLLEALAYDPLSSTIMNEWYDDPDGKPHLPLFLSHTQLVSLNEKLQRAMKNASVRLADINTAVVFEDRFNQMVKISRSKAACAWAFVSGHIHHIWQKYGEYHPLVVVDRQGGRKAYWALLGSLLSPAAVSILQENSAQSLYRVSDGSREMHVLVQVESERRHFPVALASMAAKYVRELLMSRFQSFWLLHAPQVRPTFGYFADGRRFLREIEPLISDLNIDPAAFVRRC
ncbi:MAG: hypothetical protein JXE07_08085 [Candidatus Aminicenantes bacterium]|nr:hypothetical protein [Candidatus Aminicenantes bacterium]